MSPPSDSSSISESVTIDFNHPLYLHPSDTPGTVLISHQLSRIDNYTVWSRSLRIALLAKNKLGFIDGNCKCESYSQSSLQAHAALVWADLKKRFNKVDGSRIFYLHREIATSNQGEPFVSVYFTKLKLLWDEYSALVPFSCECGFALQNCTHVSKQRLFNF
ncbi:hypothetical protein V6N13_025641 [Hibiscus sabdariffa]